MSATTPVLGGVTLPQVKADGYRATIVYLGGQTEMASGVLAFDLFSTAQKLRHELTWVALTEAQVATIQTAWATVRDGTASFTPPVGSSSTVQRDGEPTINWWPAADGPRADVTLRLRDL